MTMNKSNQLEPMLNAFFVRPRRPEHQSAQPALER